MNVYRPEITELLHSVERKYGKVLNTTTDFEVFSLQFNKISKEALSTSTLKRLWGYVGDVHEPRVHTLDLLCQYLGYAHFEAFCAFLKTSSVYNSSFFTAQKLLSGDLNFGDEVEIGWMPNRYVRLLYKGSSQYEVVQSEQSKFEKGDCFEISMFLAEQPLVLPYILRNGERTSPFIAGRNGGLTMIRVLKHE